MNIEKLKKDTVWLKEQFTKNIIDIDTINNIIDNVLDDSDNINNINPTEKKQMCPYTKDDLVNLFKVFLKNKCNTNNQLVYK